LSLAAPTLDTGFVDIPTTTGVVTASTTTYLYGAHFCNTTDNPITVSVTDTAGSKIFDTKEVPGRDVATFDWAFLPVVGLKWMASGAGLTGKIWGYTTWPL
jgi:hypothetical protein